MNVDRRAGGTAATCAAAAAGESAQDAGTGVAIGDWDDLFNAVTQRLAAILSGQASTAFEPAALGNAKAREAILGCVAALDQLHATVTAELARRDGLDLAVVEAQTSLAQVRAAMMGIQDEERRARCNTAHDDLTELPNRGHLFQRINHELSRPDTPPRTFAVLYLNLDGFKSVNDNHGHGAGDELLRIVAARLRQLMRSPDLVCRAGSDEFACLIEGLHDRVRLTQMAGRIADSISAPCMLGGLQLSVQASIGIALAPQDGWSADMLLRSADLAMQTAKRERLGHAFCGRDGPPAVTHGPGPV